MKLRTIVILKNIGTILNCNDFYYFQPILINLFFKCSHKFSMPVAELHCIRRGAQNIKGEDFEVSELHA